MLFTLKDEHKTQDHKFGVIQWRVPLLAVFPPEHLLRTDTLSERPQLLDKQAPQNHTETSALAWPLSYGRELSANMSPKISSHTHLGITSVPNSLPVFISSLFTPKHVFIVHTTIREMTQQKHKLEPHSVYCCSNTRQINNSTIFRSSLASRNRKEVPWMLQGLQAHDFIWGHGGWWAEDRGGGRSDAHGDCDSNVWLVNQVSAVQATICFMWSSGRVEKWSCLEYGGLSWRWDRRWGQPLPQTRSSAGLWPVSQHYLSDQWRVSWSSHHRRKWSDWLELVLHLTGTCLWLQGFQIWPSSYPHVAMSESDCTVLCKKSCKILVSVEERKMDFQANLLNVTEHVFHINHLQCCHLQRQTNWS